MAAWEASRRVILDFGLSLAEGKAMLAAIQTQMVTAQIERQGQTRRCWVPLRKTRGADLLG